MASAPVFAPAQVESLNLAYSGALDILESRPMLKCHMDDQVARVELAKALLELARTGESDPSRLREMALFQLSRVASQLDPFDHACPR